MASYHASVKTISRSAGRSAVAAAAYRACQKIDDLETGLTFDYRRKSGLLSSEIFLPPGAPIAMSHRAALWNAATAAETRKNSTLARELEVALPAELTQAERTNLVRKICLELVQKHGVAVDANEHLPHRRKVDADGGTNEQPKNFHAHILFSTRQLGVDGFGKKTREWDDKKSGTVEFWRERVATLTNEAYTSIQELGE